MNVTNLAKDDSSDDTMSVLVMPPSPDDEPPQSDEDGLQMVPLGMAAPLGSKVRGTVAMVPLRRRCMEGAVGRVGSR